MPSLHDPQGPPADARAPAFGWARATAIAAVIVAVSAALLLYLPDLILTDVTRVTRSGRVALATTAFFVALFALAWALRRLQARRLI